MLKLRQFSNLHVVKLTNVWLNSSLAIIPIVLQFLSGSITTEIHCLAVRGVSFLSTDSLDVYTWLMF